VISNKNQIAHIAFSEVFIYLAPCVALLSLLKQTQQCSPEERIRLGAISVMCSFVVVVRVEVAQTFSP